MSLIDALIAERNERLAFIGVDDRCPGTHPPMTSGKCPAWMMQEIYDFANQHRFYNMCQSAPTTDE